MHRLRIPLTSSRQLFSLVSPFHNVISHRHKNYSNTSSENAPSLQQQHEMRQSAPMPSPLPHIPVMAREVVKSLNPEPGKMYIDMTFGAGGHTKKLLETSPNIKVIALDRDPDAIKYAEDLEEKYPNQIIAICGRFSELPWLLKSNDIEEASIDGILFDFGCSSMQFDRPERGFSISADGPLDMRMDKDRYPDEPSAADVLATIDEIDLYKVLKFYGGEKKAKKIARTICDVRHALKSIRTTNQLANIVGSCFDDDFHVDSLNRPMHNATKTFQAIRILVNNELNEINYGMHCAEKYLKPNGRMVTLTFHSLEDTIVKRHIQGQVVQGAVNSLPLKYVNQLQICEKNIVDDFMAAKWKPLYKHVIIPSPREIDLNPRSRSAKLRAAIKI